MKINDGLIADAFFPSRGKRLVLIRCITCSEAGEKTNFPGFCG